MLLQRLASQSIVPASGDSVIKLKQVHVIRSCSRAPVLIPLMVSRRLWLQRGCYFRLKLKTIDRFLTAVVEVWEGANVHGGELLPQKMEKLR